MKPSLTIEEIRTHQHPLLPSPNDYRVVRYEVEIDPDLQRVTRILITLRSPGGDERRLSFRHPMLAESGPFQIPDGLFGRSVYVVDTSFRGWGPSVRIEVGSMAEDQPTFFYAEQVENAP